MVTIKNKELKSQVVVDEESYEKIRKKYPTSIKAIEDFIVRKCEFYSKLDQEGLEKYGFEEGKKLEWMDKIKDSVLLVQFDYKKPEPKIEKAKEDELEFYSDGELINKEFPEPEWIIKNQIPKGEVGILAGKRGERKTFFALYQAICCAAGMNCVTDEVKKKRKVFYISEEDGINALQPRIKGLKKALGLGEKKLNIKYFVQNNLKLDEKNLKFAKFIGEMEKFKPDLIIIDTLQRCVSFDVDKDNKEISEFFTGTIKPLQKSLGGTWMFIHHLRKGISGGKPIDDLMDEIRGGSEIVNYPRFVLICNVPKKSKELMVLTPVKMSYAELSEPKVVSFESEEEIGIQVEYKGTPEEVLRKEVKCAEAIKEWLFNKQIVEFRTKDIKEEKELEFGNTIKQDALKLMVGQGFLEKKKLGFYNVAGGVNRRLTS